MDSRKKHRQSQDPGHHFRALLWECVSVVWNPAKIGPLYPFVCGLGLLVPSCGVLPFYGKRVGVASQAYGRFLVFFGFFFCVLGKSHSKKKTDAVSPTSVYPRSVRELLLANAVVKYNTSYGSDM
jgi:hypothetical protein